MSQQVPAHKVNKSGKGNTFAEAMTWEASRVHQMERSEQRAWRIAFAAAVLVILSWVAIVLMLPLKETVPYVVRVDSSTGIADIMTTLNSEKVEFDEIMDRYWLARYVRARETYDWYTLAEDYNTVGLLSAPDVGRLYAAQFVGDNSIEKRNANRIRTTVEIVSIVPTPNYTATVRYRTKTAPPDGSSAPVIASHIATIAYTYKRPSAMSGSDRLINPFGFVVLSYRTDEEMGGGL